MSIKLIRRLLLVCLPVCLFIFCSVYPSINSEDKKYIKAFAGDWKLPTEIDSIHSSFENEIAFISKVQDSVVYNIRQVEIPHNYFGSVKYYYQNHTGFCYDRAVLMEKIFSYYHFAFRHLYIYFGDDTSSVAATDIFKRKLCSHGILEVKTKKGWMAIGTNANWIGLTKDKKVLTLSDIRADLKEGKLSLSKNATIGNCFWSVMGDHFKFIYGLYSRHGDFFNHHDNQLLGFYHVLPDYNLKMLFYNF